MADNDLKIKIGADISQLISDISTGTTVLQKFGQSATKNLDGASRALDSIKKSSAGVGAAFSSIPNSLSKMPGVSEALDRINKSIDTSGNEAIAAGRKLEQFSISLKTREIDAFKGSVSSLQKTIAAGGRIQLFSSSAPLIPPSVPASINQTSIALKTLRPGANQGAAALTDVSRVLQDLPFGFVGIQNNLTQLPQSFRALSIAAKESGQSMSKVLLGSLVGGGGIGLAISAVTAAVTFASVGFGGWSKILGQTSKKTEEAKTETDKYGEALKSIVSGLAEEATRVSVLVNALKGDTLSRKEKVAAIDELKKINPQYFDQLKEEGGLIKGLQNAYIGYINSLKQQFAAKALDKQLAELFDKKLTLEVDIDPKIKELTDLKPEQFAQISELEDRLRKIPEAARDFTKIKIGQPFTAAQEEASKLLSRIQSIKGNTFILDPKDQFTTKQKELENINKQIDSLLAKRNTVGKVDLDLNIGTKGTKDKKENDALKERIALLEKLGGEIGLLKTEQAELVELKIQLVLRDAAGEGFNASQIQRSINKILEEGAKLSGSEIKIPILIAPKLNIDVAGFTLKPLEGLIPEGYALGSNVVNAISRGVLSGQKDLKKTLEQINKEFEDSTNQILNQTIVNFGVNLGEALGTAIGGGESFNGLKVLLSSLATALKEMGKALIIAGVAKLQIDNALKAFGAAGMLAAGVLSVAIGAAVQAKINKIPKFAAGGIVTGPTFGLVGEAGREAIIPLNRLNEFMRPHGQDININLSGVIEGRSIKIVYDRETRSQERLF